MVHLLGSQICTSCYHFKSCKGIQIKHLYPGFCSLHRRIGGLAIKSADQLLPCKLNHGFWLICIGHPLYLHSGQPAVALLLEGWYPWLPIQVKSIDREPALAPASMCTNQTTDACWCIGSCLFYGLYRTHVKILQGQSTSCHSQSS